MKVVFSVGAGKGVCIPLRGNISLGGNTLFAVCYRDVGIKKYWKRLIFVSSVSCYVLIKDSFTKSLSDEQIRRNGNKALPIGVI